MKRLFLILLSLFILSPLTSFAGSFYNPDPEELKEKGRKAAEKLNESFVYFYQMLKNMEGRKFDVAQQNKNAFDNSLKNVLPIFGEIYNKASVKAIRFELTPQLKSNLDYIQNRFYKNQKIDTQKELTELPIILIKRLFKDSVEFEIKPEETDFFTKLRSLIMITLDVQWVGLKVSELWAVAVYN